MITFSSIRIGIFFLAITMFNVVFGQTPENNTLLRRIIPDNVKMQFAGNIGMFSTGIGYVNDTNHWKGDILYGYLPKKYSENKAIHFLTFKGKYGAIDRSYSELNVQWFNVGLWLNYAFGEKYFVKLPEYYEPMYYLIRPGLNLGGFLGSEVRYKKIGAYYEVGTTDKHIIHYFKNMRAFPITYSLNTAIGVTYHF